MVNIYDAIFNLIQAYLFGGSLLEGSPQELITVLLSSFATIFIFSIPFFVVKKVIELIFNF